MKSSISLRPHLPTRAGGVGLTGGMNAQCERAWSVWTLESVEEEAGSAAETQADPAKRAATARRCRIVRMEGFGEEIPRNPALGNHGVAKAGRGVSSFKTGSLKLAPEGRVPRVRGPHPNPRGPRSLVGGRGKDRPRIARMNADGTGLRHRVRPSDESSASRCMEVTGARRCWREEGVTDLTRRRGGCGEGKGRLLLDSCVSWAIPALSQNGGDSCGNGDSWNSSLRGPA